MSTSWTSNQSSIIREKLLRSTRFEISFSLFCQDWQLRLIESYSSERAPRSSISEDVARVRCPPNLGQLLLCRVGAPDPPVGLQASRRLCRCSRRVAAAQSVHFHARGVGTFRNTWSLRAVVLRCHRLGPRKRVPGLRRLCRLDGVAGRVSRLFPRPSLERKVDDRTWRSSGNDPLGA